MAGGRIKGITIELNGDSTKLEASLKSVNSEIKNTESKLKDVNKLLKMDPGNTNLLSQKYKTLQQEIQATKQKLDTLKEASKQADQALKDGTISKEQYDALQREIAETEQKLKGLEQEYKNFGSVQAQQVAAAGEMMKELGGKFYLRHEGRCHSYPELRPCRSGRRTGGCSTGTCHEPGSR